MPTIVNVNVSVQAAPTPSTLQKTGAFISQGATILAPNTYGLLTQYSDLTALLKGAAGISTLAWSSGTVTVTAAAPHGFAVGDTLEITITGAVPAGYNGTFLATVTSSTQFTYALVSSPGSMTTAGVYTPEDVAELTAMGQTFFAQGAATSCYVLELGPGNATDGANALAAWIAANSTPQFFYSYLVPRTWDGNAAFLSLIAQYEGNSARTYFFVTTTLATYGLYTALMKDVVTLIETPPMGLWQQNVLTAISANPAAPTLTPSGTGGSLPSETVYVRTTYVYPTGESVASAEASAAVTGPTGQVAVTSPPAAGNATGYNVYAANLAGVETLQNVSPVTIGTPYDINSLTTTGHAPPTIGVMSATTTTAHGVATGQWFNIYGCVPAAFNGWGEALAGSTGSTLYWLSPNAPGVETTLGTLAGNQVSQNAIPANEFTLAAAFWKTLNYAPSSTNKVTPLTFSYLTGVTPFPTKGLSALLTTLQSASVGYVLTGAEGGITNTILWRGFTMDGNDFTYWYSVDYAAIQTAIAVANAVINGSNNPVNPLYYDQNGINRLQKVILATMQTAVTVGLANGQVTRAALSGPDLTAALDAGTFAGQILVNAVPFVPYLTVNPGDYKIERYAGFSIQYIPQRGFVNIQINLVVTDFIAA